MLATLEALDRRVFGAINQGGPPWLDALFALFSSPVVGAFAALVLVAFLAYRYRWAALRPGVAMGLGFALSDWLGFHLLKPWFARVRPCYALPEDSVRWLLPAANVGSMPSLHAANCFAVAYVVTRFERRLGCFAYPVASLVALSRVYVGVHWPADVVVGAGWGTLAGITAWTLAQLPRASVPD